MRFGDTRFEPYCLITTLFNININSVFSLFTPTLNVFRALHSRHLRLNRLSVIIRARCSLCRIELSGNVIETTIYMYLCRIDYRYVRITLSGNVIETTGLTSSPYSVIIYYSFNTAIMVNYTTVTMSMERTRSKPRKLSSYDVEPQSGAVPVYCITDAVSTTITRGRRSSPRDPLDPRAMFNQVQQIHPLFQSNSSPVALPLPFAHLATGYW